MQNSTMMRVLLGCLLLLAETSAVRPAIAKNGKDVRSCGKPAAVAASQPSLTIANPAQDKLDAACAGDVGRIFKHDAKATIGHVNRGTLDCALLNLDSGMTEFDFQFHVSEQSLRTVVQAFLADWHLAIPYKSA
jgi:hypothetical protein